MSMVRSLTVTLSIFLTVACLAAQRHPSRSVTEQKDSIATVTVVGFNAWRGNPLDPPIIREFKSGDSGRNLANLFRQNVAEGVPFGSYRIGAYLPGYTSVLRDVNIYQRNVTIVIGLVIAPDISPVGLHGQVTGLQASAMKGTFVKLSGVYSDFSTESAINAKGEFGVSVLLDGKYLLTVVNEKGIIASREITIPDDGTTLNIEVGSTYLNATPP
jgi:hypothetical protein